MSAAAQAGTSRLAYTQSAAGGQLKGGHVMNADGSGKRRLAGSGNFPSWSPDERKIAFGGLRVVNADGSGLQRHDERHLPPGRRTGGGSPSRSAATSAARIYSDIYVINADGSGKQGDQQRWRTPVLVARRAEDRLHEAAAAVLPQLRHLRHERRRQRPPAPGAHVVWQQSSLVSRRAPDRVRPRLRHLGDERRRKRPAQAHKRCGARSRSELVARRTDDRLRSPCRKRHSASGGARH